MTFRIYRSGYLSKDHERRQMDSLLGYLDREFSNRSDEDCMIIIEPAIPYSYNGIAKQRYPDALVVKDNMFVLLELKNYDGEFKADCSKEGVWTTKDDMPLHQGRNPFRQSGGHRHALSDFLKEKFESKMNFPWYIGRDENSREKWIFEHIRSWVVSAENSKPNVIGIDPGTQQTFKVLPVEDVPGKLTFERAEKPLLTGGEFERFLEELKAIPVTKQEWLRGPITAGEEPFIGLIPKIKEWVNSGDHDAMSKALERIRELDLKQHIPHVLDCWGSPYPELRKQALSILIEWDYEKLGSVLAVGLRDEDAEIRSLSLDHISRNGYAETFDILKGILENGPINLWPKAVTALSITGKKDAANVIYDFAMMNFSDKPFRDFQNWFERAGIANAENDKEWEAFKRLETRRNVNIETFQAVIRALSRLGYSEWVPWLRRVIDSPTYLGFESDEFEYLDRLNSDYYSIFSSVCSALEILGIDANSLAESLIKRLNSSPPNYLECMIPALGEIGNQATTSSLLSLFDALESREEGEQKYLKVITANALSKLKSDEAFDRIWNLFAREVNTRSESEFHESLFDDLRRIDAKRLETKIWEIGEHSDYNEDFFTRYGHYIHKCGGGFSFNKCKSIVERKKLELDQWDSRNPLDIMVSLSSKVSPRSDIATSTGLKFLESTREDLRAAGIELARNHFLCNPEELQSLETDKSESIRMSVMYIWGDLKRQEKVEHFLQDENKQIATLAFDLLEDICPDVVYRNYNCSLGDTMYSCVFFIGTKGITFLLSNVEGQVISETDIKFLPYSSVASLSIMKLGSLAAGIIMGTFEEGDYVALVPKSATTWNYLIGKSGDLRESIEKIVNDVRSNCGPSNLGSSDIISNTVAYELLKELFVKEEATFPRYNQKITEAYTSTFEERFKPHMIKFE